MEQRDYSRLWATIRAASTSLLNKNYYGKSQSLLFNSWSHCVFHTWIQIVVLIWTSKLWNKVPFFVLDNRYKGFQGNNSEDIFQASGAYIFRPDGNTPMPMATTANVTVVKVTFLVYLKTFSKNVFHLISTNNCAGVNSFLSLEVSTAVSVKWTFAIFILRAKSFKKCDKFSTITRVK